MEIDFCPKSSAFCITKPQRNSFCGLDKRAHGYDKESVPGVDGDRKTSLLLFDAVG